MLRSVLLSKEWRDWSRRKKVAAIVIMLLFIVSLIAIPDLMMVAGIFDAALLDALITLIGVQLFLYSGQIKAGFYLASKTLVRRYKALKGP